MQIKYENIILRDMIETDIEDYVRWFTAEREWEKWDAPWEKEDTDEETERKEWTKYYESVKNRPDDAYRWKFEILWNGKHIGWVSSYCIDENYEWVGKAEEGQIVHRAVGIDICESDSWGNSRTLHINPHQNPNCSRIASGWGAPTKWGPSAVRLSESWSRTIRSGCCPNTHSGTQFHQSRPTRSTTRHNAPTEQT